MYVSILASILSHSFSTHGCFSSPLHTFIIHRKKKELCSTWNDKNGNKKKIFPLFIIKISHLFIASSAAWCWGPIASELTYTHTHTFMFVNKRIFPIAAWLLLLPIVWRLQLKIPTFVHFSIAIVIGRLLTTTTTTLNFFQCMLCIRIIFWQWETPRYISFFDAQKHSWLLVYFRVTLCEVGYFVSCNNIFNLWVLKVRIFIIWHFQVPLSVNFRIA